MNPLYKQIIDSNQQLHGWATVDKAITLSNMVLAQRPSVVLEIGVWGGRSLIPMALACKSIGWGTVIGVDPWSPEESEKGQVTEADKKWWSEQNHEMVFQTFKNHLRKMELEPWVEIHRVSSDRFTAPESIGLLHVDGNHGPQALSDITRFGANVISGGLCVLDDTNWTGNSVKNGGEWLTNNNFIKLHPLGTGDVYLKL
jgi:hypothetical protein